MSLADPQTPIESLARIVHPAFKQDGFRANRNRPIVFVCGGSSSKALRKQFLSHVLKADPPILPILAERAFPHQLVEENLQRFETFLAETADCVLVFVESIGSYAETGLFAALKAIARKTYIVNTRKNSEAKSFLNHGPIKLIKKQSRFDDVYVLGTKKVASSDAKKILSKIVDTLPKYDNALAFGLNATTGDDGRGKFSELRLHLQLAAVYLGVRLIRVGDIDLFTGVFRALFRDVSKERIEAYLSLLVNFSLIKRSDDLYYNLDRRLSLTDLLIAKQNFQPDSIKTRSLEWHLKHSTQTAVFLREHGVGR